MCWCASYSINCAIILTGEKSQHKVIHLSQYILDCTCSTALASITLSAEIKYTEYP